MVKSVPDMREIITAEIKAYVSEDKGNICEELQSPYYEEPI
ncbi:(Fe-S)-binding protein, partial [Paenibacillus sp. 28ISP30-2]|nr:(Fe-S)-binding protein [Paenibacillus sp. 28ISP30-2]